VLALETPAALLSALEAEVKRFPAGLDRQVEALAELFALFTRERGSLRGQAYMDIPRLRGAYLRYHLPLNAARASSALRQVAALHPQVQDLEDVVDLGAGPGSASLATLLTLSPARSRRYWLSDRSRSSLQIASRLLRACAEARAPEAGEVAGTGATGRAGGVSTASEAAGASQTDPSAAGATGVASAGRVADAPCAGSGLAAVSCEVGRLPSLPRMPRRALVWLSMVLNELQAGSRKGFDAAGFLGGLARRLGGSSVVLVLEPALREPGRQLLRLHDAALKSGAWRVLAPCTHQLLCPLLREKDRSWCHFHFRWEAPRLVREVADPLRLEHEAPSFAFLALLREAPGSAPPGGGARPPVMGARTIAARVIGDPMPVRGGKRAVYMCAEGRRRLISSPPAGLRRGDVVDVDPGGRPRTRIPWE
jgi:hypothetical protein